MMNENLTNHIKRVQILASLKNLFSQNKFKNILSELKKIDDLSFECLELENQLNRLKENKLSPLVRYEDTQIEYNKLSRSILKLILKSIDSNNEILSKIFMSLDSRLKLGSGFKGKKDNLINFYEESKEFIRDKDLKYLEKKISIVNNKKFKIAFLGPGKAGKSSLINTVLGNNLLPVGVTQKTSAIIRITKEDCNSLIITYADDKQKRLNQIDEFTHVLNKVGALQDKVKDLPIHSLNRMIKEGYDHNSLDFVMNEIQEHRPNHLKLEQFKTEVRHYLEVTSVGDIVEDITIELKDLNVNFENVEILDTPGINAIGDSEELAYELIGNMPDAIFFIYPLTEAIETKSFANFFEKGNKLNLKNKLFLVLTKSGVVTNQSRIEKVNRAKELFGHSIALDRIICIDSIYELIFQDLIYVENISQLKKNYTENNFQLDNSNLLQEHKRESFKKIYLKDGFDQVDDINELRVAAFEESNFYQLTTALSNFVKNAPVDKINSVYDEINKILLNEKTNLENQIKILNITDKKEFKKVIKRTLKEINYEEKKVTDFIKWLKRNKMVNKFKYKQKEIVNEFKDEVDESDSKGDFLWDIECLNSKTEKNIKKIFAIFIEAAKNRLESNDIHVFVPELDFKIPKLKKKRGRKRIETAKNNSTRIIDVTVLWIFRTGKRVEFDEIEFLKKSRKLIKKSGKSFSKEVIDWFEMIVDDQISIIYDVYNDYISNRYKILNGLKDKLSSKQVLEIKLSRLNNHVKKHENAHNNG